MGAVTICPLICMSAGHWRPLDGQVPMKVDEMILHPSWSGNLRAGFLDDSLARRRFLAPHLLQVPPAPSTPRYWIVFSLMMPVWSRSCQGRGLGPDGCPAEPYQWVLRGREESRSQGSSIDLPSLLGDLLCYLQCCRREEPKAWLYFALQRKWIFGTVQGTTEYNIVLFWTFLHKRVN